MTACTYLQKNIDIPLLLIRLTVGVIFIQTGWGKISHFSNTVEYFTMLGIPMPAINAAMASVTEFGGGICTVLGLMSRLVSIPLSFVMCVAILTAQLTEIHSLSDFIRLQELDYMLFFVTLIFAGAGKFSVDYLIKKKLS